MNEAIEVLADQVEEENVVSMILDFSLRKFVNSRWNFLSIVSKFWAKSKLKFVFFLWMLEIFTS